MRTLVAGGAGMIGSALCEALLDAGAAVCCVDSLVTGRRENVAHLEARGDFCLVLADVVDDRFLATAGALGPFDRIFHLASPASPVDFDRIPIEILRAGAEGTRHLLELARRDGARFLLASTSEVYGEPEVSPQHEAYVGHVNPVGPRSVYDEAKRFAEAMTAAYGRHLGVSVRIARIFNTYGPRARDDDGRVVSTFVRQALCGEPLTIHGDGRQTRSFCYVDDLVAGLLALIEGDYPGPVNLGNAEEVSIDELAATLETVLGVALERRYVDAMPDAPTRRRPDTSLARSRLGWRAEIPLEEGLRRYVASRRGVVAGPR